MTDDNELRRALIPKGPIDTEPRSGEFVPSDQQRLILRGWLEVSDVDLGDYDRKIVAWAAEAWDWSTFAVITSWIRRAYDAGYAQRQADIAETQPTRSEME